MKSFKQFLLEGAASPFLKNDPATKKAAGVVKQYGMTKQQIQQALREMYRELLPKLKKIQKQYENVVKKSLPKGDKQAITSVGPNMKMITGRFKSVIKPEDSFVNKIAERGTAIDTIGDLVRGALLFKSQNMVEEFVTDFRRKNSSIIVDYEMKKRGSDPELGYFGSHHLDLMIGGLVVELQIMTRKMWNYKTAAHDIYTKNRDKIAAGGHAAKFDAQLSKKLYSIANREDFEGFTEDDFEILIDEDFADFLGSEESLMEFYIEA